MDNILIIGHSLGAHLSGFAGKRIQEVAKKKIPRIVASDPAGPVFSDRPCDERLCKEDASRVVIFHTSYLGIEQPMGHIDYYVGNLDTQPECDYNIVCSHHRPMVYLTETLNDETCVFPGSRA